MKHSLLSALCLALVLGFPIGSAALDTTPLPEEMTEDGIRFRTGGIGLTERQELTALEGQYSLKLVFALQEGNYVADVTVDIRDASGRQLLKATGGPWFYAKLPAGNYAVQATRDGQTRSKEFRLTGKGLTTLRLLW